MLTIAGSRTHLPLAIYKQFMSRDKHTGIQQRHIEICMEQEHHNDEYMREGKRSKVIGLL